MNHRFEHADELCVFADITNGPYFEHCTLLLLIFKLNIRSMQKLCALLSVVLCCTTTVLLAQPPGGGQMDPAAMVQRMKERMKPMLIEKTKLSDAQADKVIETQVCAMGEMRGMRDLTEDQRAAKMKSINEEKEKKWKDIPLTDDQIKSVNTFFEEMRKNRMQGSGGPRQGAGK